MKRKTNLELRGTSDLPGGQKEDEKIKQPYKIHFKNLSSFILMLQSGTASTEGHYNKKKDGLLKVRLGGR